MRFKAGFPVAFASLLAARAASAYAGPDSVAVLANADVPESVALAKKYMAARSVPAKYLCALSMPVKDDLTLAEYQAKVDGPFEACLKSAGIDGRIEAVVVMRGVPLRVAIPVQSGTQNVALAAALGAWRSADGTGAVLGQAPGATVDCGGTPCLGAKWANPYKSVTGPITPAMTVTANGVTWKPLLVTMLHGRSYADAERLITSAVDAEKAGGAPGTFVLMDGADPARGALDGEFPTVLSQLKAAGFTDAQEVPFASAWAGPPTIAAFFVGTASLGTTIESNTYAPGALVDNLTSFGAVPQNFAASGESQVSIARWVAKGVGGVHGTVDEPLNNCFPSRRLIVDYVSGAPLAEAYLRRMPFAYWRNLVLGDPMLAPYAKRPVVTLTGVPTGAATSAVKVTATAVDKAGTGIETLRLYADGDLLAETQADTLTACVPIKAGKTVELLAVAQNKAGTNALARFPPKGWTSASVQGAVDMPGCPDAPPLDGGTTPGPTPEPSDGGCSCDAAGTGNGSSVLGVLGLGVVAGALARRRRRQG
jgi:MYXO-CTERM domain-containing protein